MIPLKMFENRRLSRKFKKRKRYICKLHTHPYFKMAERLIDGLCIYKVGKDYYILMRKTESEDLLSYLSNNTRFRIRENYMNNENRRSEDPFAPHNLNQINIELDYVKNQSLAQTDNFMDDMKVEEFI